MQISIAGLSVCAALMALGFCLRAPLVVGLFASLPFGATAIATLPAFGGSSPLIFVVFVMLLLCFVSLNFNFLHELGAVFRQSWTPWIVLILAFYAVAGAVLLPRIFMGQTSALIPWDGQVLAVPLMPVSGNITQAGYFALGAMMFLGLSILLVDTRKFDAIQAGVFTWVVLHVTLGFVDWTTSFLGIGDVLAPIRTASYNMFNGVEEAGFQRITGAYSEASAFGGASLACVALTFTYWKKTGSTAALVLAFMCLALLLLSTSSSAYVGAVIISLPVLGSISWHIATGRIERKELVLLALLAICAVAIAGIYLYSERILDPVIDLFQSTIVNKAASASAQERAHWNYVSLQSFFDTAGLGIGMGSSRASSWPVAVVSQLGVVGVVFQLALVASLLYGMRGLTPEREDLGRMAVASSLRAGALAGLVGSTIAGGSADPGLLFFIALAVVGACRRDISRRQPGRAQPPETFIYSDPALTPRIA